MIQNINQVFQLIKNFFSQKLDYKKMMKIIFQNLFSNSSDDKFIFLNNLNFSIITAQEYIEHTINIKITDLTTISARKKRLIKEKSVLVPKPTACDAMSASMFYSSHLNVS